MPQVRPAAATPARNAVARPAARHPAGLPQEGPVSSTRPAVTAKTPRATECEARRENRSTPRPTSTTANELENNPKPATRYRQPRHLRLHAERDVLPDRLGGRSDAFGWSCLLSKP